MKRLIKALPIVGPTLASLRRLHSVRAFRSADYWERRYRSGGNSGEGSYNRLARMKAEVINNFVREHKIQSVIEFGSGDGAQLALAEYPQYVGVDVSRSVVNATQKAFANQPHIRFMHTSETTPQAELSLSLDVVYHLVEDDVFDTYMRRLFDAATKAVIIYSSNEDLPWGGGHIRHRRFTDWIEQHRQDLARLEHIPNRYPAIEGVGDTSRADFYIYLKAS
jgi:hypothetical protein